MRGGGGGNEVEKWSLSTSGVIPIHCGGDLLKGEMECENKLISHERPFKMLENDMCVAEIGRAVHELLSFKFGSGNHQREISLLQRFSDIFSNMRLVPLKNDVTSDKSQFRILKIEIFSKLYKI